MKQELIHLLAAIILIAAICSNVNGQVVLTDEVSLNLQGSKRIIENTISIDVSKWEYESIKSITGEKVDIRADVLIINGDTLTPEDISTRGNTTLQFKRKSFSFRLTSAASFRHGENARKLKKFDVVNLAMDKYYTRNGLAFNMMQCIELFDLFYAYCDLRINGKSEGIFMIIEKPDDWAINRANSPLVLRRGYDHAIEKIKTDKKVVGEKLIFSSEDLLDVTIAKDPYLYDKYLKTLKEILEELTPAELKVIFEDTYAELFPYYSENEIISNSQYDIYKDANLENLNIEMVTLFIGLKSARAGYLEFLGSR